MGKQRFRAFEPIETTFRDGLRQNVRRQMLIFISSYMFPRRQGYVR